MNNVLLYLQRSCPVGGIAYIIPNWCHKGCRIPGNRAVCWNHCLGKQYDKSSALLSLCKPMLTRGELSPHWVNKKKSNSVPRCHHEVDKYHEFIWTGWRNQNHYSISIIVCCQYIGFIHKIQISQLTSRFGGDETSIQFSISLSVALLVMGKLRVPFTTINNIMIYYIYHCHH